MTDHQPTLTLPRVNEVDWRALVHAKLRAIDDLHDGICRSEPPVNEATPTPQEAADGEWYKLALFRAGGYSD